MSQISNSTPHWWMVNKEASETQVERSGQKNEEVKKRSKEEKAHNKDKRKVGCNVSDVRTTLLRCAFFPP